MPTTAIRRRSFLLAFIVLMMALPWQLLCAAHPTGHQHHVHEGLSPCELHAKYGHTHTILPPMHCKYVQLVTDDLELQFHQTPAPELSAVIAAFIIIDIDLPEQVFFSTPDPKGNSDPPLPYLPQRAPPIS